MYTQMAWPFANEVVTICWIKFSCWIQCSLRWLDLFVKLYASLICTPTVIRTAKTTELHLNHMVHFNSRENCFHEHVVLTCSSFPKCWITLSVKGKIQHICTTLSKCCISNTFKHVDLTIKVWSLLGPFLNVASPFQWRVKSNTFYNTFKTLNF